MAEIAARSRGRLVRNAGKAIMGRDTDVLRASAMDLVGLRSLPEACMYRGSVIPRRTWSHQWQGTRRKSE
jgi:hypothetical protein